MDSFVNIAAYQFARLTELKGLRVRLVEVCRAGKLRGTILLSLEGMNLFVAGAAVEIEKLLVEIRSIPGLEKLTPKYSQSAEQPFNRMLVRIKKEIISFGVEGIRPEERTSPKLSALALKQWLDEGRPVTLLDTRNDYEVKLGTFRGAKILPISHFRQFPDAVRELPEELKEQPIVMFCTGGIRCEKAGPFMEREGFKNIAQLDGGILKYFEECGSAHYEGECFVFDKRVGVDPALQETSSKQCYACLAPLTEEDQEDPRFQPAKTCPYCFKSSEEKRLELQRTYQEKIRAATVPLPGSTPYTQRKPVAVSAKFVGLTLIDFLSTVFPHVTREVWLQRISDGAITWLPRHAPSHDPASPEQVVKDGERFYVAQLNMIEPDVATQIEVLYQDEALLVLSKPAPLPIHPCGRFNLNTLLHFLCQAYHPERPRAAHRLDANTTGVLVCTRTRRFASLLQPQFDRGEVEKVYYADVLGHPLWPGGEYLCDAPIAKESGDLGTREVDEEAGLPAITEFRLIQRWDDGTSSLEIRPRTGRTNQIRVHLWELGFPIVGDPLYLPDRQLGSRSTLGVDDPPLRLHAGKIAFKHPVTGNRVSFEVPCPSWSSIVERDIVGVIS